MKEIIPRHVGCPQIAFQIEAPGSVQPKLDRLLPSEYGTRCQTCLRCSLSPRFYKEMS